jgi:hypothetical protein
MTLTCQRQPSDMADPITLLGLASSIITFVEFGYKVTAAAKQVRDSAQGMTKEIEELGLIVQDINASNDRVKKANPVGRQQTDDEARILAMVKECQILTDSLGKIMGKLNKRAGAHSKTLESGRVAFQSLWKHTELQELRARLEALASRIRINVELAMQR